MLSILKWYSIIVIIVLLITALKTQLDGDAPKGYFLIIFFSFTPILFYLFTT
jgi:hypothetical protein